MKIISKHKDYYDGVQSLGFDESLIYRRFEETKCYSDVDGYLNFQKSLPDSLELQKINLDKENYYSPENYISVNEVIIGFCGYLYPAITFEHYKEGAIINTDFFYTSESVINFLNDLKRKHKFSRLGDYYNHTVPAPSIKELDDFLKNSALKKSYSNWFQLFECPIFLFSSDPKFKQYYLSRVFRNTNRNDKIWIAKNPNLKKMKFYKVKDSFSAFQELSQYLGGVLTNREQPQSNLTDKEKILQHGFDLKYGFRNRPKK